MPEQRKTPARRAGGKDKTGLDVRLKISPSLPVRQELCQSCHYFRAVRSGQRLRTFCLFTGEKIRPSTPACAFWPGESCADAVIDVPDSAIFGLTRGKRSGKVEVPNDSRPSKCLLALPKGWEKSCRNSLLLKSALLVALEIGRAAKRPVSARTGGHESAGERFVALPFFCV